MPGDYERITITDNIGTQYLHYDPIIRDYISIPPDTQDWEKDISEGEQITKLNLQLEAETEGWRKEIEESESFVSLSKTIITNPKSTVYTENSIWIQIRALPIERLTNNIRADKAYKYNEPQKSNISDSLVKLSKSAQYTFKFLAPPEILEQLSHDWQPYDSVAGSISQTGTSIFNSMVEQLKGLDPSFYNAGNKSIAQVIKEIANRIKNTANSINKSDKKKWATSLNAIIGGIQEMTRGGDVANYRVDTPLSYKGSERRSFSLPFTLINVEGGKNHENVVFPVKLLEMLSSPSYPEVANQNFNSDIILPYLFEIKTTPGDLIICDLAVLKQVQPTWRGPWIDGYPSRCELRLDFTEYRPLEQKVFYGYNNLNKILNVSIKTLQEDRWNTKEMQPFKFNEKNLPTKK